MDTRNKHGPRQGRGLHENRRILHTALADREVSCCVEKRVSVEKIQQRTVEKTKSMRFIYSVLAMYVMKLTFAARVLPDWPCEVFLDETEWKFPSGNAFVG